MTHPNVEYFRARSEIANEETIKAYNAMLALEQKTEDPEVAAILNHARVRMQANMFLVKTLLDTVEDYEERAALLK